MRDPVANIERFVEQAEAAADEAVRNVATGGSLKNELVNLYLAGVNAGLEHSVETMTGTGTAT